MTADMDLIIDLAVNDAEQRVGRPPEWMAAKGHVQQRPIVASTKRTHSPRWTPEEDDYLRAHFQYLPVEMIAAALGRTVIGVRMRVRRKAIPTPRHTPGYLSASQIAKILGVDNHAPPNWIDRGFLAGEPYPYSGVKAQFYQRVRIAVFMRWIIKPTSWVYFDIGKVRNGHIRRLICLAQQRWNDEWWTTRQVADYHHVTVNAIVVSIKNGHLPGYRADGMERRRTQRWAYWFVKRSDVEKWIAPRYGDPKYPWTPRADAFILRARAEGKYYRDIARMMHWPEKRVMYRFKQLTKGL